MRAQADGSSGVTIEDLEAELDRRYRAYEADILVPPPIDGAKPPLPEAPAGYWERSGHTRDSEEAAGLEDNLVRDLRIGTQGSGRGLAGVAGLPVDLAELGINAGAAAVDAVAGTDLPRVENSVGSSEWIAEQTARLVEALGGDEGVFE